VKFQAVIAALLLIVAAFLCVLDRVIFGNDR
jgi:hypothetical protein